MQRLHLLYSRDRCYYSAYREKMPPAARRVDLIRKMPILAVCAIIYFYYHPFTATRAVSEPIYPE